MSVASLRDDLKAARSRLAAMKSNRSACGPQLPGVDYEGVKATIGGAAHGEQYWASVRQQEETVSRLERELRDAIVASE